MIGVKYVKKILLLVTDSFPFGFGEAPFILPELPHLQKEFDKLIIFSMNITEYKTNDISSDIFVYRRRTKYTLFNKIIYGVKSLFTSLLWEEISSIKQNYGLSLSRIKDAIKYMIISSSILKEILSLELINNKENKFLLYTYWYTEGTLAAIRLKKYYPQLKVITRTHGYDLYLERKRNSYQPFKKWMDKRIDRVYFVSLAGEKYYKEHYKCSEDKYFLSYLGVRSPVPCVQWKLSSHKVLLSCSSIIPIKRVELIIYGLSKINNIKIHWVHFGGGAEENSMKQLAKKLLGHKENITYDFRGTVQNSKVINYISKKSIDSFISTSFTEGLPVSMMEAASYKIPIIGTNVGGIGEIVIPSGGVLLPQNPTSQEVAEAIETVLSWDETTMLDKREQVYRTWKELFDADRNGQKFAKEISNLFDK